jgi:hypothetical protein
MNNVNPPLIPPSPRGTELSTFFRTGQHFAKGDGTLRQGGQTPFLCRTGVQDDLLLFTGSKDMLQELLRIPAGNNVKVTSEDIHKLLHIMIKIVFEEEQ